MNTLLVVKPKLLAVWLLVSLLLAGCAQQAPRPRYRIGFAQCSTKGPWRQAMVAGMERELSFHPEVRLRMLNSQDNSELQKRQIPSWWRVASTC